MGKSVDKSMGKSTSKSRAIKPVREIKSRSKLSEKNSQRKGAMDIKPVRRSVEHAPHRPEILHDENKTGVFDSKLPGPGIAFNKAMKYLDTLTDYERLRIVRYNS